MIIIQCDRCSNQYEPPEQRLIHNVSIPLERAYEFNNRAIYKAKDVSLCSPCIKALQEWWKAI